jgi:hypothetical protein
VPSLRQKNITKISRRKGYWMILENRRKFLIDLATTKGLDPFKAATWYTLTTKDILQAGVCELVFFFYKCALCMKFFDLD